LVADQIVAGSTDERIRVVERLLDDRAHVGVVVVARNRNLDPAE